MSRMVSERRIESASGSSLVVGERVVSRCEDGLFVAEYALFDRSDVMLTSARGGQGAQEKGYLTTAGFARGHLEEAGITVDLARAALGALRPEQLSALASSPAVLRVVDQLGPGEAFEGGSFVASSGRYLGTWLDLDALAEATSRNVAILLQALHLLFVVEEVPEDVPVRLFTPSHGAHGGAPGVSAGQRTGERTWRKVPLEAAQDLPSLLHAMPAPEPLRAERDEANVREALLRDLRARATASEKSRARLVHLASRFAGMGRTPPPGLPSVLDAPSETWRTLPPPAATPSLDDPATFSDEVRRHSGGLHAGPDIRATAERLSSMASHTLAPPELVLLAARAQLAAGEVVRARQFAENVVQNPDVADAVRLTALEILDATALGNTSASPSTAPPSASFPSAELAPIEPLPIVVLVGEPGSEPLPPPPPEPALPPPPESPQSSAAREVAAPSVPTPFPEQAFAIVVAASPSTSSRAAARYVRPEVVETMSLPSGAEESMLGPGTLPRGELQARIAMTRLARDVGRDYRLWYGTALKTDLLAIDAMQRHLRRRFSGETTREGDARRLEKELLRHGALLSEILARRLGAEWVDVAQPHPGQWVMIVLPNERISPIGRVYRFVREGQQASDLVAFYLELETHSKTK